MNTKMTIIMLLSVLSLSTGNADQEKVEISREEYEASIASFGVSQTDSAIASQEASRIAEELRQRDEADPMDSLPDNWLEGTPY
jgi:hypothetical protein